MSESSNVPNVRMASETEHFKRHMCVTFLQIFSLMNSDALPPAVLFEQSLPDGIPAGNHIAS